MKLFISWSGPKSKAVATALRGWIPSVINEVKPFMSAESIESGTRWQAIIAKELETTDFGLVCTTAANQEKPWLNFEAGALAKKLDDSRVVPIAIDLAPSEIRQPLGQFNGNPLTKEGVRKMLHSINAAADAPLDHQLLDKSIEVWWPELDREIKDLPSDSEGKSPIERTDREILLELLDSVRGIVKTNSWEFSNFTEHLHSDLTPTTQLIKKDGKYVVVLNDGSLYRTPKRLSGEALEDFLRLRQPGIKRSAEANPGSHPDDEDGEIAFVN